MALQSMRLSRLMNSRLWNVRHLEAEQQLVKDEKIAEGLEVICFFMYSKLCKVLV